MATSRRETEGLGVVVAIVLVVAGLTALRYAPWVLGAAVLAIVIALLTPRQIAGKAALCALAVAAIAAPLAAIAATSDYQQTTTRRVASRSVPGRAPAAATRRSSIEASGDASRKASHASPADRRVIERKGFLPAWNPSHGLLGPFHPSALKRWWALTASVTVALTALLSAVLLSAAAVYTRQRPPTARHASWPRVGQNSRTWPPS